MAQSVHPVRAFRLRQEPPLRLKQLAERVGRSKATLSQIENHKRPVSLDLLPTLAQVTGIAPQELRPDLPELLKAPLEESEEAR